MAKKTVFFSTMTFYDPLLYTYSCWSAATKIILCAYCLFCVLLRGTLHGSWSLVCLYWAPGSVVNLSLFFLFLPLLYTQFCQWRAGVTFFLLFLVFSLVLLHFPSFLLGEEQRREDGRAGKPKKKNTVKQGILGGIRNWARIPFHGWRGRICMVAIN